MVRDYLGIWILSRKIEISVGIFIIGFEINQDFLKSQKQQGLGLELDPDASSLICSLFEMTYKHF